MEEQYVRAVCPNCQNEREFINQATWGYKQVYAETTFYCPTCRETSIYKSELSLFGDWILSKQVVQDQP